MMRTFLALTVLATMVCSVEAGPFKRSRASTTCSGGSCGVQSNQSFNSQNAFVPQTYNAPIPAAMPSATVNPTLSSNPPQTIVVNGVEYVRVK